MTTPEVQGVPKWAYTTCSKRIEVWYAASGELLVMVDGKLPIYFADYSTAVG